MKERNIKISIEKAREWYSYGGELKKNVNGLFVLTQINSQSNVILFIPIFCLSNRKRLQENSLIIFKN